MVYYMAIHTSRVSGWEMEEAGPSKMSVTTYIALSHHYQATTNYFHGYYKFESWIQERCGTRKDLCEEIYTSKYGKSGHIHKVRIYGWTQMKVDKFVIRQLWQKHQLKMSAVTLLMARHISVVITFLNLCSGEASSERQPWH